MDGDGEHTALARLVGEIDPLAPLIREAESQAGTSASMAIAVAMRAMLDLTKEIFSDLNLLMLRTD